MPMVPKPKMTAKRYSKKTTSKPVLLGGGAKKAAATRAQEKKKAKNKVMAERATRTHGSAKTKGFAFGSKTI